MVVKNFIEVFINGITYKYKSLYFLTYEKQTIISNFEVDPYDPCVANKMIDSAQFIIVWHVDDLKLSHNFILKLSCVLDLLVYISFFL